MTRDELVTLVLNRCGRRAADTALTGYAVTELQAIQKRFESGLMHPQTGGTFMPWFLISESATANMTTGEERIALPDGFLAEMEDGALWTRESASDNWTALKKDQYDVLQRALPGEGLPQAYARRGDYWILFPTPDSGYELRTLVYVEEAALDTNISNAWTTTAQNLMISELGRVISAFYLYNSNLAGAFQADRDAELMRLWVRNEEQQYTNFEMRMGG